jgi:hypothetical protein
MNPQLRRYMAAAAVVIVLIAAVIGIRSCLQPQTKVKVGSGQVTSLGDVKWQVVSVLKTKQISLSGKAITAKGWYMIIDLYLENTGKSTLTFDPASIELKDGKGVAYTADHAATDKQIGQTASASLGSIFGATLKGGEKKRFVGVFDISETATAMQLTILGSKYGSNKDLVIALGF